MMPNCGYCRDCKWWEERFHEKLLGREGYCNRLGEHGSNFKACFVFSQVEDDPDLHFMTQPDFGCVQWEKK